MRTLLTSLVLLLSITTFAAENLKLGSGDFSSAKRLERSASILVSARLSKTGLAKFRELNRTMIGSKIAIEIAGIASNFILREAIRGESLEMGPYSEPEAQKVIEAINLKAQ